MWKINGIKFSFFFHSLTHSRFYFFNIYIYNKFPGLKIRRRRKALKIHTMAYMKNEEQLHHHHVQKKTTHTHKHTPK